MGYEWMITASSPHFYERNRWLGSTTEEIFYLCTINNRAHWVGWNKVDPVYTLDGQINGTIKNYIFN